MADKVEAEIDGLRAKILEEAGEVINLRGQLDVACQALDRESRRLADLRDEDDRRADLRAELVEAGDRNERQSTIIEGLREELATAKEKIERRAMQVEGLLDERLENRQELSRVRRTLADLSVSSDRMAESAGRNAGRIRRLGLGLVKLGICPADAVERGDVRPDELALETIRQMRAADVDGTTGPRNPCEVHGPILAHDDCLTCTNWLRSRTVRVKGGESWPNGEARHPGQSCCTGGHDGD